MLQPPNYFFGGVGGWGGGIISLCTFGQVCKEWIGLLHITVLQKLYHQIWFQKLKSTYIFLLENTERASNLLLVELIFNCPTIVLNGLLTVIFLKSIAKVIISVIIIFVYTRAGISKGLVSIGYIVWNLRNS